MLSRSPNLIPTADDESVGTGSSHARHEPGARNGRAPVSILALVPEAYGGYGGIAQSARDMIGALSRWNDAGHICVMPRMVRGDPAVEAPNVAQCAAVPGRVAYSLAAARHRPRAHVIYCGHLFMAPLAAALARMWRARMICHLHGVEIWNRPTRLQRFSLERSDLAFCVSRDTETRLHRFAPAMRCRSMVVHNTVDPSFSPGDRAAARRRFGLSGEFALLTVSRLDADQRHKGHERVIMALPALLRAGHDVVYLIAGEGDDRPRLEAVALSMGLDRRVRFLGRIGAAALPDLYRAADLYAMPSTGEGFGIAFIEAMACGTRALGLAVGGSPEALCGGAPEALCGGGMGRAVPEDSFEDALADMVAGERPDPAGLARAVQSRFGRAAFEERVHAALDGTLG